MCARWQTFANFHADVGKRPSWDYLLIRRDTSLEFSPDNAAWRPAHAYRWRGHGVRKRARQ
jgi:hypothetical protein